MKNYVMGLKDLLMVKGEMTLLEMDNTIQEFLGCKSSLFDNVYEAIDFENWTYNIGNSEDMITVEFKIIEMNEDMIKIKVIPYNIYNM